MSRNLYAATTSASNELTVKFRLLLDIDSYTTGSVRACTGGNFISVGVTTYSPVGYLGGLEPIKEESDVFPRALRCWLSAISTTSIQDVISESAYNKPVRLYRCFITDSMTVVNTPEVLFKGRINTAQMKLGDPERGNFYEIEVDSRLAQKARAAYLTKETHWTIFNQSGDTFFDHLSKIPLFKSQWGSGEVRLDGSSPARRPNVGYYPGIIGGVSGYGRCAPKDHKELSERMAVWLYGYSSKDIQTCISGSAFINDR